MNYNALIDARCPVGLPWAVVNEQGQVVACVLSEDDARRDAASRMNGTGALSMPDRAQGQAIAAGLGIPLDLPNPTPTTGRAASARPQGGSVGGGAQPGAVITPDQGGPSISAGAGPQYGKGGGATQGYQTGAVLRPDMTTGFQASAGQNTTQGMGGGYRQGRGIDLPDIEERGVDGQIWADVDLELRADGSGLHFTGYAAVFDTPSLPLQGGKFVETIQPGAFSRSLKADRDIKMFVNHDPGLGVLGSVRAGTLRLSEDSRGLLAEAELPDNEWGRPVADAIRRGDIDNMSFTFKKIRDTWTDGGSRRSLDEVKLFEVSPMLAAAAYPSTSVAMRSLGDLLKSDVRNPEIRSLVERLTALLAGRGEIEPADTRRVPLSVAKSRLRLLEARAH